MTDIFKYTIGPGSLLTNVKQVTVSGETFGVYSAMTQLLTSGPNGQSTLTGLSLTIMLTENATDAGYYSVFDGAIFQKDVVCNFIFSSTTQTPYTYTVYNTSEDYLKFLELSEYEINWGDNSQPEKITTGNLNYLSHNYPIENSEYVITLTQTNPWGITKVVKTVSTPYVNQIISNPNGTAFFTPKGGNWSGTPLQYDYIFSGDAVNVVSAQTTNNYISIPYLLSGECNSRIGELKQYGSRPITSPLFNSNYELGVPVIYNGQIWGVVNNAEPGVFTGYTIQNVDYFDYQNGKTIYFLKSSGFTEDNLNAVPITKNETFLKIAYEPKIQTSVFVERGSNSAMEIIQRLGEVDTIGDMINYGYNFFKIQNKT